MPSAANNHFSHVKYLNTEHKNLQFFILFYCPSLLSPLFDLNIPHGSVELFCLERRFQNHPSLCTASVIHHTRTLSPSMFKVLQKKKKKTLFAKKFIYFFFWRGVIQMQNGLKMSSRTAGAVAERHSVRSHSVEI